MSQTLLTSQPPPSSFTLQQAWSQAQRAIQHTQSPPPNTPPDHLITLYTTAFHSLLTLRTLIHTIGPFSSNDLLIDLPTPSLRYALLPTQLAALLLSWPGGLDGRRGRLEQCMALWRQLLDGVDLMDGLTDGEERRWRQVRAAVMEEAGEEAEEEAESKVDARGAGMDAGQQRQEKIARFKQQREWQQQIEAYEAKQQQRRQSRQRTRKQGAAAADEEAAEAIDDEDDEAARQYWLLRLRVAINNALDELLTGHQELQFLKERQAREADPQLKNQREREEEDRRRQHAGHKPTTYTISSSDQLHSQPIPAHMQAYLHTLPQQPTSTTPNPSTAHNTTTQLTTLANLTRPSRRDDVFRLVNGPTLSVEQWAEQEMREGRLPMPQRQVWRPSREQRGYVGAGGSGEGGGGGGSVGEGEGEEDGVGEVGGEGDERRLDAKRGEEREWDNWKDDHERGAGNRKR